MSRQLTDLEQTLSLLIAEHRKLLTQTEAQQKAMREMRAEQIEQVTALQEMTRLRINTLDTRRKSIVTQLGRILRIEGEPTIAQVAVAFPQHALKLQHLRHELRELV